jgi:hypothetical protein
MESALARMNPARGDQFDLCLKNPCAVGLVPGFFV